MTVVTYARKYPDLSAEEKIRYDTLRAAEKAGRKNRTPGWWKFKDEADAMLGGLRPVEVETFVIPKPPEWRGSATTLRGVGAGPAAAP
jgi:hypothetical protein